MLTGSNDEALDRFRCALRIALQQRAPAVFLHHYTECILDCLEASGDHAQALELTVRALDEQDPQGEVLGEAVRAALVQRQILLLFALDRTVEGDAALEAMTDRTGPVLAALTEARRRRLTVDARWLDELKRRHLPSAVTVEHLRGDDATRGEELFQKEYAHG